METDVIKIGNSKGIRIPAYVLKECNIVDRIKMEIRNGKIILSPMELPRKNWGKQFQSMHEEGADKLLIDEALSLEAEEWEW